MPVHQRYSKFQKDQRQFFDQLITEDWETYKSEAWDYTRAFEVRELFKRVRPKLILDIGCGVGFRDVLMAIYPYVDGVDAIDYSEQSILRAETTHPHPKISRKVADFLSFQPSTTYDLVISFQVLEHLDDPGAYFEFCVRVCKPGGVVAVCTPNRVRWENRIRAVRRQPPAMVDVMHFREYSASEIFKMGNNVGLQPAGWFGHTLAAHFANSLNYRLRTKLGYLLPNFSSVICVLMRKPSE